MIPKFEIGGGKNKHSGPIHMSAPDAFIRIYSWKDQYTLDENSSPDGDSSVSFNIYGDILSIQTEKHKESAANWNVTLASSREYNSIIHPGDWITIHISDQKIDFTDEAEFRKSIKMIGIVRTVRKIESANPETGQRYTKFVIAGNDFSSALHLPIYVNSALLNSKSGFDAAKETLLLSIMTGKEDKKQSRFGSPARNVRRCLSLIFAGGQADGTSYMMVGYQFKVPEELFKAIHGPAYKLKGTSFLNFVDKDFQSNLIGTSDVRPDLGGVVDGWSLIKAYSNPVVNEFYADLFIKDDTDVAPTLVLRSMPFNRGKGKPYGQCLSIRNGLEPISKSGDNKLYVSKEISESEIINLNFGRSDADRFNFWLVVPNQAASEKFNLDTLENALHSMSGGGKGAISVLSHLKSIMRYGLRPFVSNTIYHIESENAYQILYRIARDMWDDAVFYENGVVEIIGCPIHIPVGTNIKFTERSWVAHVESVSYTYSVEPGSGKKVFKTSIGFIRLQDEKTGKPLFVETEYLRDEFDPGMTTWPRDDDSHKSTTSIIKPSIKPSKPKVASSVNPKPPEKKKKKKKKGKKDKLLSGLNFGSSSDKSKTTV